MPPEQLLGWSALGQQQPSDVICKPLARQADMILATACCAVCCWEVLCLSRASTRTLPYLGPVPRRLAVLQLCGAAGCRQRYPGGQDLPEWHPHPRAAHDSYPHHQAVGHHLLHCGGADCRWLVVSLQWQPLVWLTGGARGAVVTLLLQGLLHEAELTGQSGRAAATVCRTAALLTMKWKNLPRHLLLHEESESFALYMYVGARLRQGICRVCDLPSLLSCRQGGAVCARRRHCGRRHRRHGVANAHSGTCQCCPLCFCRMAAALCCSPWWCVFPRCLIAPRWIQ